MKPLEPGATVIVRDCYASSTEAASPIAGVNLCTDRDFVGCTGVILDMDDTQALVAFDVTKPGDVVITINGFEGVFAVGMLEAW